MTEPLLTARELAAYLGVNVDTVYQKAQSGEIPVAFRAGPRLRFDRAAVLAAQHVDIPVTPVPDG